MTQTATTIEQSKRILSLGIDPETADMFYTNYVNKPNDGIAYIGKVGIRKDLIPAWSLSAICELMPEVQPCKYGDGGWEAQFQMVKEINKWEAHFDEMSGNGKSPITACIDLIEELVEQGYIKTKKKEQ